MDYNSPMTMAEVAICISNALDQAIAGAGQGKAPKDGFLAKGSILGQRRICVALPSNI